MEIRTCQNCKKDFVIDQEDQNFYDRIKVPAPTFCPNCRAQRRMVFRAQRALNKRTSSLTGETIFSTYPADAIFPVYTQLQWHGDDWDPTTYGREYDFSRPFFEQFKELSDIVPRPAKSIIRDVNSPYSNNATNIKNCYMVFNTTNVEDSAYGVQNNRSKNCIDCTLLDSVELSYEVFDSGSSSRVFFSKEIAYSSDIWFSRGLRGCTDCFGCTNLRKKSFYILNEPYHTKEAYDAKLAQLGFNTGSYGFVQKMIEQSFARWNSYPHKYITDGSKSVNVSGEYLFHCKNVRNSYEIFEAEDLRYCQGLITAGTKNAYDHLAYGHNVELTYECVTVGGQSANVRFCVQCYDGVQDLEYCDYCIGASAHLFGCVGMKKKQYCILNKQYTKEEYYALREKIIKHMNDVPYKVLIPDPQSPVPKEIEYKYGEFFPPEFSPFGYNETTAQEQFVLTKKQALEKGYKWREQETRDYKPSIMASDLPDHINDVDESILDEVIGCLHSSREFAFDPLNTSASVPLNTSASVPHLLCNQNCTIAFKLIPQELQFYKRFKLPLPRLCPNCRHAERMSKRNSLILTKRQCMCQGTGIGEQGSGNTYTNIGLPHSTHKNEEPCTIEFETAYRPDQPEIVYCRECYQAEIN